MCDLADTFSILVIHELKSFLQSLSAVGILNSIFADGEVNETLPVLYAYSFYPEPVFLKQ
jgi:hypothetical protein